MIKRHTKILVIVSFAIIIRLFFSSFPPFKTDMDSFIAWGEQMYALGPAKFYNSGIWTDYAPGYMYFMWTVAAIKNIFFSHTSREMYELLHKSVPMIFDVLTGLMIYKTIRLTIRSRSSANNFQTYYLPEIISAIYLFSPFTFFTSAVWGQVDSVFAFFLLLSFYYLIKNRIPLSCIVFVVASVIKPQSVVFAPLYLLVFIHKIDIKLFAKSAIVSVLTFYILTIPFFGLSALQGVWNVLNGSIEVYPYSSINTFNYWGIFGFWNTDTLPYFMGLNQRAFGYLIWILTLIYGLVLGIKYLKIKGSISAQNASLLASFFILSAVMFMTRMHERYLFPLFVYFFVGVGLYTYYYIESKTKDQKSVIMLWLMWAIFLSTIMLHTINLYYVYVYYRYFTMDPQMSVPVENKFYYFIESRLITWSYIQVSVYLVFAVSLPYYLKRYAHTNKQ